MQTLETLGTVEKFKVFEVIVDNTITESKLRKRQKDLTKSLSLSGKRFKTAVKELKEDKLIVKIPCRFIQSENRATITEYIANDIVSHQSTDVFNSLKFKHQEFIFDMVRLKVTHRSEALERMKLEKSTVYQRFKELQALGIIILDKKGKIYISADLFYEFSSGELQARETQLRLQKDNSELKKENQELRRQLSSSTIDYSKLFSKTMAYEY